MHHLIVGNGENVILRECIHQGEREFIMDSPTEQRIRLHVFKQVVGPTHIPLEVEAQTAIVNGFGDHRPGGRLLRHHQNIGELTENGTVQLTEERNGFLIMIAAVLIGDPLAGSPVVIQIQHRCHRIHPETVCVVLSQPEQSVGNQEGLHLGTAHVKAAGTPSLMLHTVPSLVFVQGTAVELIQAVTVLREMGGHPVQNHADAGAVHSINEILEILRSAETAGGRIVSRHLVSPGAVKGMLHHRHQLHVGIPHLRQVRSQHIRDVAVVHIVLSILHGGIVFRMPGAQMHLIDVHRKRIEMALLFPAANLRVFLSLRHPFPVLPIVGDVRADHGGTVREGLVLPGIRIGLHKGTPSTADRILIIGSLQRGITDDGGLPHAGIRQTGHGPAVRPCTEITDHTDLIRVGCPHTECILIRCIAFCGVHTQKFIGCVIGSLMEQIQRQRAFSFFDHFSLLMLFQTSLHDRMPEMGRNIPPASL